MSSTYTDFTTTRPTEPDFFALLDALRAIDPTAGVLHTPGTPDYKVKTSTPPDGAQIGALQQAIDTAPVASERLAARRRVQHWSLYDRAQAVALLDLVNQTRAHLHPPLPPLTLPDYQQAIQQHVDDLAAD